MALKEASLKAEQIPSRNHLWNEFIPHKHKVLVLKVLIVVAFEAWHSLCILLLWWGCVEQGTHWKPLPDLNNKILALTKTYVISEVGLSWDQCGDCVNGRLYSKCEIKLYWDLFSILCIFPATIKLSQRLQIQAYIFKVGNKTKYFCVFE